MNDSRFERRTRGRSKAGKGERKERRRRVPPHPLFSRQARPPPLSTSFTFSTFSPPLSHPTQRPPPPHIHTRNSPPGTIRQGDPIPLKVNKLASVKTQLPFDFYSLPFCRPDKIVPSAENLGEVLRGDRIKNSAYEVAFKVDQACKVLCVKGPLTAEEAEQFSKAVRFRSWISFPRCARVESLRESEGKRRAREREERGKEKSDGSDDEENAPPSFFSALLSLHTQKKSKRSQNPSRSPRSTVGTLSWTICPS